MTLPNHLTSASVQKVARALADAGSPARILYLADTARSAQDAAASIGCDLGAIVKTLVFAIGDTAVIALVAGDRQCNSAALPALLRVVGVARRANADEVREATGYAIGGVAPLGYPKPLPVAMDASLARYQTVYAAAGHPHCVFATSVSELQRITGGILSDHLAQSGAALAEQ